jgi:hypothetical protein
MCCTNYRYVCYSVWIPYVTGRTQTEYSCGEVSEENVKIEREVF